MLVADSSDTADSHCRCTSIIDQYAIEAPSAMWNNGTTEVKKSISLT